MMTLVNHSSDWNENSGQFGRDVGLLPTQGHTTVVVFSFLIFLADSFLIFVFSLSLSLYNYLRKVRAGVETEHAAGKSHPLVMARWQLLTRIWGKENLHVHGFVFTWPITILDSAPLLFSYRERSRDVTLRVCKSVRVSNETEGHELRLHR